MIQCYIIKYFQRKDTEKIQLENEVGVKFEHKQKSIVIKNSRKYKALNNKESTWNDIVKISERCSFAKVMML